MKEWLGGCPAAGKSVKHIQRTIGFTHTSTQGLLLLPSVFLVEQVVQLFNHKPEQVGTQE